MSSSTKPSICHFCPGDKERQISTPWYSTLACLYWQGNAPGFAQHVNLIWAWGQAPLLLDLVFASSASQWVNRLILHTPDSLYQRIASKPTVYQNVIYTKPAIDGREKHPQNHLNLVRVQFFRLAVYESLIRLQLYYLHGSCFLVIPNGRSCFFPFSQCKTGNPVV